MGGLRAPSYAADALATNTCSICRSVSASKKEWSTLQGQGPKSNLIATLAGAAAKEATTAAAIQWRDHKRLGQTANNSGN